MTCPSSQLDCRADTLRCSGQSWVGGGRAKAFAQSFLYDALASHKKDAARSSTSSLFVHHACQVVRVRCLSSG